MGRAQTDPHNREQGGIGGLWAPQMRLPPQIWDTALSAHLCQFFLARKQFPESPEILKFRSAVPFPSLIAHFSMGHGSTEILGRLSVPRVHRSVLSGIWILVRIWCHQSLEDRDLEEAMRGAGCWVRRMPGHSTPSEVPDQRYFSSWRV